LAAGLSLYILTSTVLGIAQNAALRATPTPERPELIKPNNTKKKRKQHFYTKAQERKRQMKKEQDRNKK
jgi:membrane protein insertase Oxa1/YidC/SpoIIIJ